MRWEAVESIKIKFYHWWQYTKNCFRIKNPFMSQARQLTKITEHTIRLVNHSARAHLLHDYFDSWLPTVFGIFFTVTDYHKTIQTLALSGFGLHAFHLIRSQLESLLIFLYFIEPDENLSEIETRVNAYLDWVIVKMYVNMTNSADFPVLQALSNYHQYVQQITETYQDLEKRYQEKKTTLNELKRSSSFLKNKPQLAEKYGFKSLYNHIQSESSASIHTADISDRIAEIMTTDSHEYHFNVLLDEARWTVLLSNLLQAYLLRNLAKFFRIEDPVISMLKDEI